MSTSSTILEDILQALKNCSHHILDVETKVKRVIDFRETIVADLHRKIQDGVISEQDSLEFEYVTDLWTNLYKSFLCRSAGADFADRDVITYLIELYGLKQISKELFVQIVLELCRNYGQSLNLL